ncbi:MAG: hypothetical protein V1915_04935 [Candidatus Bathyarchaeota archaeon]
MSDFVSFEGRKPKAEALIHLAPRPTTLKDKTVALYHNDKVASFAVMRTVRKELEKYGVKEIFEVHSGAPFARHPDRAIEEALKADVVFTGTAD